MQKKLTIDNSFLWFLSMFGYKIRIKSGRCQTQVKKAYFWTHKILSWSQKAVAKQIPIKQTSTAIIITLIIQWPILIPRKKIVRFGSFTLPKDNIIFLEKTQFALLINRPYHIFQVHKIYISLYLICGAKLK